MLRVVNGHSRFAMIRAFGAQQGLPRQQAAAGFGAAASRGLPIGHRSPKTRSCPVLKAVFTSTERGMVDQ